ncbi:hypothetical protein B0H14DRAFT_2622598 [Mycena olivaceomarginata]|nr:hypothetical protein B0H14DRAFT_2622598 [Mycena olivaceomarginata]
MLLLARPAAPACLLCLPVLPATFAPFAAILPLHLQNPSQSINFILTTKYQFRPILDLSMMLYEELPAKNVLVKFWPDGVFNHGQYIEPKLHSDLYAQQQYSAKT